MEIILLCFGIIFIAIALILKIIRENKIKYKNESQHVFKGELNYYIMTKNENIFFQKLKQITDKYNLLLFTKIRLADLIKTYDIISFNKVNSKHIDFVICLENSHPIVFIELDDYSHKKEKNRINDNKKNEIFIKLQYELIRIKINDMDKKIYEIEEIIKNKLGYNEYIE